MNTEQTSLLLKIGGELVIVTPNNILKGGSIILDNGWIITSPTIIGDPTYTLEPKNELPAGVDTGILLVSCTITLNTKEGITDQIVTQYDLKPRVLVRNNTTVQLIIQPVQMMQGLMPLDWELAVKEPPIHTVLRVKKGLMPLDWELAVKEPPIHTVLRVKKG